MSTKTQNSPDKFLGWLEKKTIAFVGDSITADLKSNYVTLIVDKLVDVIDVSSIVITNSAADSSSIFDALDQLPDVLLEYDPDVFVVFLGINDSKIFYKIDRPLIAPDVFEASYASFLDYLDADRTRDKVLVTPPPLHFQEIRAGDYLADYWYWTPSLYAKYISAIKRVAKRPRCVVADAYGLFTQTGLENQRLFYEDGVHPNIHGHRLIASLVLDAFSQLGKSAQ